jgi:glycosyltransferase involved in cell wall biosynthesis
MAHIQEGGVMKAAYDHPDISSRSAGLKTPLRAALDTAGIDVVAADDVVDIRNVDIWISEGCGAGATNLAGAEACRELGIPFVVAEPDTKIAINDDRDAALQIAGQATLIVTTSSATARYFANLKSDSVTLLSAFVDVDPFRAAYKIRQSHKSQLASNLRLPESSPWLLTDGAMEPGGGLQSYEVLARALSRLALLDWRLIVIARGKAMAEAKEPLLRLPQERIRYCEPLPEPDFAALCVSCDMYLWPAIGDSATCSLLAAQACGVPVIAGRTEDTEDRVIDGQTGRLTPIGNAESFANAVSFLLRHPNFRQSFSEEARDMVYSQFNLDKAASRLREVLVTLCQ